MANSDDLARVYYLDAWRAPEQPAVYLPAVRDESDQAEIRASIQEVVNLGQTIAAYVVELKLYGEHENESVRRIADTILDSLSEQIQGLPDNEIS